METLLSGHSRNQTTQVCQDLGDKFGLKILSSDIIWTPNEDTRSKIDTSIESERFIELLAGLRGHSDVQAIYSNVTRGDISDDEWSQIEENLDILCAGNGFTMPRAIVQYRRHAPQGGTMLAQISVSGYLYIRNS